MKDAAIAPSKSSQRPYLILLTLLAMGCFGLFSTLEVNEWLKVYGLILSLQGGFALVYFALKGRRDRPRRRSTPAAHPKKM